MASYDNQQALVIGLGLSGVAAATLLRARGGRVLGVDTADTPALRETSARLAALGVEVRLGASHAPEGRFDLAVLSPGVPADLPLLAEVRALGIPILGELELGYRESLCLNVAITGTDGKTTTTRLIEAVLRNSHRKTVAAGNVGGGRCDRARGEAGPAAGRLIGSEGPGPQTRCSCSWVEACQAPVPSKRRIRHSSRPGCGSQPA